MNQNDACLRLWMAVLALAVEDYRNNRYHLGALSWFKSDADTPGSFLWICDLFGINRSRFLAALEDGVRYVDRSDPKKPTERAVRLEVLMRAASRQIGRSTIAEAA